VGNGEGPANVNYTVLVISLVLVELIVPDGETELFACHNQLLW
jgi:hypothetical protein